jgi:hypothetical protein
MANRRSGQRNPQSLMVSLLDVAFILLRLAIKACSEAKVVERRMGMPTEGQYSTEITGGNCEFERRGDLLVKVCAVCTGKSYSNTPLVMEWFCESMNAFPGIVH